MENKNTKKILISIIAIIIIAVIVASVRHSGSNGANDQAANSTSTAMISAATSTQGSLAGLPQVIIYGVATDKTIYAQNDQIKITLKVINNTDATSTFNFPNGCQGNYTIGSFDMIKHTRCTPEPTSFALAPHSDKLIGLVHYPSVFKLPVGKTTLTASVTGYGSSSVKIEITGPAVAAAQPLKIISPNGGESFISNSFIPVTWTQTYGSDSVQVYIRSKNAGVVYQSPKMTFKSGQGNWAIPLDATKKICSDVAGSVPNCHLDVGYKIGVMTDTIPGVAGEKISDESDDFITITK